MFQGADVGDSCEEFVEHHAFVEGVLVDDEEPLLVLDGEVAGVDLEDIDFVGDWGEEAVIALWGWEWIEGWEVWCLEDLGDL